MINKTGFDALGPVFASHGWVFFGPYRRGQGLSASVGPYIGDQIAAAEKNGGIAGRNYVAFAGDVSPERPARRTCVGCEIIVSFKRIVSP